MSELQVATETVRDAGSRAQALMTEFADARSQCDATAAALLAESWTGPAAAMYFSLGAEWDDIKVAQYLDDNGMFGRYNIRFLDQGIRDGRTFVFSHDPEIDTLTLHKEREYLNDHGYRYDPRDDDIVAQVRSVMQTAEFFDLVEDFFGPRAINKGFAQAEAQVTGTLYETFRLTCSLGGEHGEFGAGIETASGRHLGTFFGRSLSLNSDRASILESLSIVDEWCRLHLPDKFLERYDAALASR